MSPLRPHLALSTPHAPPSVQLFGKVLGCDGRLCAPRVHLLHDGDCHLDAANME